MKAKKLLISIFVALTAMFCILAVNTNAGIYVFPEEIDLAIDTLRPGENPSYTLYSTETEKYYAEVDGWSDIGGQPIASSAVLQRDARYKLLLTVTTVGDYSLNKEVPCFVNGVCGTAVKQISQTKVQYEVTLPVYDYKIIDMFELHTEIYHGMAAKDYDKIVKILTPHVEFTADTKENGLNITNLTNESDKSGIFKYGNSYYITFSVQPETGYDFALNGTVNLTGVGPYALDVAYIRSKDDSVWVIGVEVLANAYPIEIEQVDLEFEPKLNSVNYGSMLRCKTDNVEIKNPVVTLQTSGESAGALSTGAYNLDFELQTAEGYVLSRDCKINMSVIPSGLPSLFSYDEIELFDETLNCSLKFQITSEEALPIEINRVDLEFEPQKYSGKYEGMLRCKTENVKIKKPFVTYQGSGREAGVLLTGDYNLEFELQAADGYVFSKDCKINMTIISMDKTITFTHDAIEQNDKSVDCALKFHLKFFDCIAWLFRQIGKWFK